MRSALPLFWSVVGHVLPPCLPRINDSIAGFVLRFPPRLKLLLSLLKSLHRFLARCGFKIVFPPVPFVLRTSHMLERQQTRPRAFGIGADAPILSPRARQNMEPATV